MPEKRVYLKPRSLTKREGKKPLSVPALFYDNFKF